MFEIDSDAALGKLLNTYLLRVPFYQREYSWKGSHVGELFDDLRRAIEDGASDYFLGSIIACKVSDGELEIVDGQQRLATASILFAKMRDYAHESDDQRAVDLLTTEFLYRARSITEGDDEYNLRLSETDDAFFRETVLAHPDERNEPESVKSLRDSNRKIWAAAGVARKHVKAITAGKNKPDSMVTIQKWIEFIKFKAKVILVIVETHEEAHKIFETMNDRGLDLSIADLTKNHLFLKANDRVTEAKAMWYRMAGALESVSKRDITKSYLHHLFCSQYGVAKSRDVFGQIRKRTSTRADALEFARHLSENADIYAATFNPDGEYWNEYGADARKNIRVITSGLRVVQIRILLLAVIAKFSKSELKKLLPRAVCWSVRFLIAGGPTGNLETAYSKNAVKVSKGEITTADELASAMKKYVPNDESFEASFASASVTTNYLAKYYLQCLERAATDQTNPHQGEDDGELGSLEHILPRTPDDSWTIPTEQSREYVNKIGNLALLDGNSNSTRGNGPFSEAQETYGRCEAFQLTKELADLPPKWGIEEIEARQEKLAKYALKAWPA